MGAKRIGGLDNHVEVAEVRADQDCALALLQFVQRVIRAAYLDDVADVGVAEVGQAQHIVVVLQIVDEDIAGQALDQSLAGSRANNMAHIALHRRPPPPIEVIDYHTSQAAEGISQPGRQHSCHPGANLICADGV